MRRYLAITGLLGLALAGFVAMATLATSAPAEIEEKRSEAQLVLAQIQDLDGRLGLAIENYNGSMLKLSEIDGRLEATGQRLDIARKSNQVAQRRLSERLRALYMAEGASSLEVMLGATTVEELMDRVETVERVSEHDTELVEMARGARQETSQREKKLEDAYKSQQLIVAERDQKRRDIENMIQDRERLAASIEDELEELIAAEAIRQEELKKAAERRLAAQREEAQRAEQQATQAAPADAPATSRASPAPAPSSGASPPPAPAPPPPAAKYTGVVGTAMQFLGTPYVWGGSSPSGFDCSGFVMYVYAKHGVSLPHHAATQYNYGAPVSRGELQPGDIVYFNGLGHNGIYIGGGQFIHSPRTGDVVKISSLFDSWYSATFVGARRL